MDYLPFDLWKLIFSYLIFGETQTHLVCKKWNSIPYTHGIFMPIKTKKYIKYLTKNSSSFVFLEKMVFHSAYPYNGISAYEFYEFIAKWIIEFYSCEKIEEKEWTWKNHEYHFKIMDFATPPSIFESFSKHIHLWSKDKTKHLFPFAFVFHFDYIEYEQIQNHYSFFQFSFHRFVFVKMDLDQFEIFMNQYKPISIHNQIEIETLNVGNINIYNGNISFSKNLNLSGLVNLLREFKKWTGKNVKHLHTLINPKTCEFFDQEIDLKPSFLSLFQESLIDFISFGIYYQRCEIQRKLVDQLKYIYQMSKHPICLICEERKSLIEWMQRLSYYFPLFIISTFFKPSTFMQIPNIIGFQFIPSCFIEIDKSHFIPSLSISKQIQTFFEKQVEEKWNEKWDLIFDLDNIHYIKVVKKDWVSSSFIKMIMKHEMIRIEMIQ